MRRPEYLSPTSLALFHKNVEQYYIRYLCDTKMPRESQTDPMAVGSSFDAFVKAHLYKTLVGGNDSRFVLETLFEAQVEQHARDKAWTAGKHVFEFYKECGALADLLKEMKDCLGEPRFEIEVRSDITHRGRTVPFLGKPDVFFVNAMGGHIILDFKVNGYYAFKSAVSPYKGYLRLYPGLGQHMDCISCEHFGMQVNKLYSLNMMNEEWAAQLSIYAWLCGVEIGSEWVAGIDQIACNATIYRPPQLRVAQHRTLVDVDFQQQLFQKAADAWEIISSDHIFRQMSKEDSQARCKMLDDQVDMLKNQAGDDDADFMRMIRGGRF